MPFCTECGGEISQGVAYCQHCGGSQANVATSPDPAVQPSKRGGGFRKVLKWTGIGCGGLVGLFVLIMIIGIFASATEDDAEENQSVEKAVVERTTGAEATPPPTSMPEAVPTPTVMPTVIPTSTPVPTATPNPPIQVELIELLQEYDQNKVRANARLRYQENGRVPVSTSGYVDEVEELFVVITPLREGFSSERLYCYYADTRAALELTKGHFVSVTGRVRGDDGYSSRIYMFACEFEGVELDKNPPISAEELRQNAVKVFCKAGSIFASGRQGTGVVINVDEGIILTVHHVVADENECEKIEVELPGVEERVPVETVRHCASIDRARLRVSPQVLSQLSLQTIHRSAAPAHTDQEIYFWGYGPGELRKATGIVKDVLREDVVVDAYAVPGDSGAPVFDEYGHLLGTMSRSNRSDRAVFTGDEC